MAAEITYLQNATSESDLTTYTFSSQSLGSAVADRQIIVGVWGLRSSQTATVSVTVAGITASKVVEQISNNGTGLGVAALYIAAVPTGTTGDVVVTYGSGGNQSRVFIAMWKGTGLNSTPEDIGSSTSSPASDSLTVSANSAQVAFAGITNQNGAWTWAGVTEDFDDVVGSSGREATGGHVNTASAGTVTPSATPPSSGDQAMVCASFASSAVTFTPRVSFIM